MKIVDARGLSCPEPVLMTKRAVKDGEFPFRVLVNDASPKENVIRFAKNNGFKTELSSEEDEYIIEISK